ncbi:MAG: hypothetical protein APF81_09020 [Desulfosporosinus sp. BRH_c37]|nr:MAG: hypothetical protein APF81_09020 [Desulfosporosinus sp. BRH_c37]
MKRSYPQKDGYSIKDIRALIQCQCDHNVPINNIRTVSLIDSHVDILKLYMATGVRQGEITKLNLNSFVSKF